MLASLVELQTGVQLIARRARVGAYTGSPLVRFKKRIMMVIGTLY